MRTDLLNVAAADAVLRPHATLIVAAVRQSFADWATVLSNNPTETAGLGNRTRRSYLHDRITHQLAAAEVRGEAPGIRVRKINGLNVVIVADSLLLKVKKLDKNFRSRNIRTGQTVRFDMQEPLVDDDAFRITHATGGYVEDATGAAPLHVIATCWERDENLWTLKLDTERSPDGPVVEFGAEPFDDASGEAAS